MYQIVIDNHKGDKFIIHDSRSNDLKVANAVCELELNKTGSLTFKISPTHPNFGDIEKHLTEVYLLQDGEVLFCGRVLNDDTDIFNFKTVVCEGMLGYLLDSVQRAKSYSKTGDNKIKDYLTDILNIHNSQMKDNEFKKFSLGTITEVDNSDTFYKLSTYENTLDTLSSDLIDTFNHTYLIPRVKNGKKYIDYLTSKELPKNDQVIQFGKNLLKFNRTVKGEEIATVIMPLGAVIETDDENVEKRLTIEDIPDGHITGYIYKEADYIYDDDAVKKYGWIVKPLVWNGVNEDINELKNNAIEQLNYYSKLAKNVELNAFDLHLLDANIDSFRVGQKVKVYSKDHDLKDDYLIVQKMTIDINQPDKTTIVLGDEERISVDINSSVSKQIDDANKIINDYDKTFDDYDSKFKGYDEKFDNFNPTDYVTNDKFGNLNDEYFNTQVGTGTLTDLSRYALKSDVQSAFDELATLIEGV